MPSVLEAPPSAQEESVHATEPLRPMKAGLMTRLVAYFSGSKKNLPLSYHWGEETPKPPEEPRDRVAREFPQLFLLSHCG